jgi:hypothetical protein
MVLADSLSDAGNNLAQGEKLPDEERFLTFRLTVRNMLNGFGCFFFPDDSIHIEVVNTGKRFRVTSQQERGLLFLGGSAQQVTWDVAGTSSAPIDASTVDIYMTQDGGQTWPWFLGNFPNNGAAVVLLPNPDTTITAARFKVKGTRNVFFQVNGADFSVFNNSDSSGGIKIFPVPTRHTLNILTGKLGTVDVVVYDILGRLTWSGTVSGIGAIDVAYWPRGMYFVKTKDITGSIGTRKLIVY